MHIILGDRKYVGKRIPIQELNNTIFAVRYSLTPIPKYDSQFWCAGVLIQPPIGDNLYYHEEPFLVRVKEEEGDLLINSTLSKGFPAINALSTTAIKQFGDSIQKRTGQASIRDYDYLQTTLSSMLGGLNWTLTLSRRVQNLKDTKQLIEFLATEQANGDFQKGREILQRYDDFKSMRLLSAINADMLGSLKSRFKNYFTKPLLNLYKARDSIQKEQWDDTIKTLNAMQPLIQKESFMSDPMFIDLLERMRQDGIVIETEIRVR